HIVRADSRLVWLNVMLLLCIAFQPFPTTVLGVYDSTPAVTLYAGTLSITGLVLLVLWLYASAGRRLLRKDVNERLIRYYALRAAGVPVVFVVSIGIAQVNTIAAELSWSAILAVIALLRRVYRDAV